MLADELCADLLSPQGLICLLQSFPFNRFFGMDVPGPRSSYRKTWFGGGGWDSVGEDHVVFFHNMHVIFLQVSWIVVRLEKQRWRMETVHKFELLLDELLSDNRLGLPMFLIFLRIIHSLNGS